MRQTMALIGIVWRNYRSAFLSVLLLLTGTISAQGQYVVNGDAVQLSCNCYRLTEAVNNQGGAVWNSNMISLADSFDFTFDVLLGYTGSGADGIAFVLQPVSTAEGNWGGGMGYGSITPSLAIEVDTYQNNWDPTYDHIAIQKNGDVNHTTGNNLAGPELALVSGGNIEDGLTHVMRVTWDPVTQTVNAYMDGSLRISYSGDVVANIFSADPMVFWGFTGSTGGLDNVQEFCLSIIPGLTANISEVCAGDSVAFGDDSYSALGDVVSWDWNFGNGQTSVLQNPGAVQFEQPGTFQVVQTIVDAAGCDATDSIEIQVDPNPLADFTGTDVCLGDETTLTDQSSISSGTLNSWSWDLGNSTSVTGSSTSLTYAEAGMYAVVLDVTSDAGCTDTASATVTVFQNPDAGMTAETDGSDAIISTDLLSGEQAEWTVLDSTFSGASTFNYTFPDSGWYDLTLVLMNSNGCADTVVYPVYIEGIPEYQVPNVFTPNGDDMNDRFEPYTYAMVSASLKIFNRWGRPVFEYDGIIPQNGPWGWDGTVQGSADAASGTYYFVLHLKGTDGTDTEQNGSLTLIR